MRFAASGLFPVIARPVSQVPLDRSVCVPDNPIEPGSVTRELSLGEAFAWALDEEQSGRAEQAAQIYWQILELAPGHAASAHNLASVRRRQGRMPEARALFRKALEAKPDSCITLYQLVATQRYRCSGHEDVVHIKRLLRAAGLTRDDAALLYFALGKIYDDCGEFEPAFRCFEQGNRIKHRSARFDAGAFATYVERVMGVFSKDRLMRSRRHALATELPVFIIGMPRSGTSLVEQIVASHPRVHGAGELLIVDEVIASIQAGDPKNRGYPECAVGVGVDVLRAQARRHESFLREKCRAGEIRVTDKMPYNFKCAGLITQLFRDARFIHCERDPRDVCLSNFFQLYLGSHDHNYSLGDLGHYYRQYARLTQHWRNVLPPTRWLDLSYEQLVAEPESGARRLIEFLGLPWEQGCLAPHRSRRWVDTASAWQVRQPIYHRGLGRWKNYEPWLGPLLQILDRDGNQ